MSLPALTLTSRQAEVAARRPLAGRVIVTTRETRSALDSQLAVRGADVVHVPLISIESTAEHQRALAAVIDELTPGDWVVVTSRHGARACGPLVFGLGVRLAAVGAATAEVFADLAGRSVDVVPSDQRADALAAALPDGRGRVVLAQADRADGTLASALAARGYSVTVVTAYRTALRFPTPAERAAAATADAVLFASGSAAESWADAIGADARPLAVAIGPSTAAAAERVDIAVTSIAATHDVTGLVEAVTTALATTS